MVDNQVMRVLDAFRRQSLRIVTAESCTGGLIAAALTEIGGSSDVVEGGFVTYSNALKQSALGVQAATLQIHGAVSEATVAEMAEGALRSAPDASVSIAVSGVAGPGGGSPDKPVGLVCFGWMKRGHAASSAARNFPGDRRAVRAATVGYALTLLEQIAADASD
jgi:nicotinamide-nucleotide amidase